MEKTTEMAQKVPVIAMREKDRHQYFEMKKDEKLVKSQELKSKESHQNSQQETVIPAVNKEEQQPLKNKIAQKVFNGVPNETPYKKKIVPKMIEKFQKKAHQDHQPVK